MRPRILYELSRHLARLLEAGLKGGVQERPIPVHLCHPLDPLERGEELEAGGPVGVLYLSRVSRKRLPLGPTFEESPQGFEGQHFRWPALPAAAHYVFFLAGGSLEEQLTAIAAALQTLHDHRLLEFAPAGEPGAAAGEPAPAAAFGPSGEYGPAGESDVWRCPLAIVDEEEGWRELGLPEHRLTIAFEVTVVIPSARIEAVARVGERRVQVEEDGP